MIANTMVTSQERERLSKVFMAMDTNGDGVLSMAELQNGYKNVYGI
jgi:Ca2+-binding EF-hand superfamily protein